MDIGKDQPLPPPPGEKLPNRAISPQLQTGTNSEMRSPAVEVIQEENGVLFFSGPWTEVSGALIDGLNEQGLPISDTGGGSTVKRARARGGIDGLRQGTQDGEPVQIAVKIPKRTDTPNAPKEFNDEKFQYWVNSIRSEGIVLDRIRAKQQELFPGSQSHVPDSVLVNLNGLPAVAMELIPSSHSIWRALDTPQQAQDALVQYGELVATMHALGIAVSDRASSDVYLDKERNRLFILDWNIVNSITPDRVKNDYFNAIDTIIETLSTSKSFDTTELTEKLNILRSTVRDFPLDQVISDQDMMQRMRDIAT